MENDIYYDSPYSIALRRNFNFSGLSISEVARATGINRVTLSKMTNGYRKCSKEQWDIIKLAFAKLSDNAFTVIFDYLRVRFKTTDWRKVVRECLNMRCERFVSMDIRRYHYDNVYHCLDICVCVSDDKKMGTLIELKGQGCRQYERILLAQKKDWWTFLSDLSRQGAIFKRIDVAINDIVGLLDIPDLIKKTENGECVTLFRNFKAIKAGEMPDYLWREEHKDEMGNTLYLGSRSGLIHFCVYEKDYEQFIKKEIPLDESPVKNRFEIRLQDERADKFVIEYNRSFGDIEAVAFDIINYYVRYIVPEPDNPDKPHHRLKTDPVWDIFIGQGRKPIKLATDPQWTRLGNERWLNHSVAPSVKFINKVHAIEGREGYYAEVVNRAKLSKEQQHYLDMLTIDIENDLIYEFTYVNYCDDDNNDNEE